MIVEPILGLVGAEEFTAKTNPIHALVSYICAISGNVCCKRDLCVPFFRHPVYKSEYLKQTSLMFLNPKK